VPDLTNEQVLSILGRIEAELNAADQMRLALKQIGIVIQRYREIEPKLGELAKEEVRLRNVLAGLESEIEEKRRAGALKIQTEFDTLHASMTSRIDPLALALKEASDRVTKAEARAVEVETESATRIKAAESAASSAEARLAAVNSDLAKLADRFAIKV